MQTSYTVTVIVCVIMVILLAFAIHATWSALTRARKRTESLLALALNATPAPNLPHNYVTADFIIEDGGRQRLKDQIADFDVSIFWSDIPSRQRFWIDHGHGIFVATGIFFTFSGIVIGLWSINLDHGPEGLAQGIFGLINGLKVAFLSSLIGVFSSIILIAIKSHYTGMVKNESSKLRRKLIEENRLLIPESILAQMQATLALSHAELQRTRNILSELRESSQDQSNKLGQLATDIASSITQQLVPQMESMLNSQVADRLDAINGTFSNFASGQVASQSDALANVVQSFVDQLHTRLHDQFDELAKALADTRAWYDETRVVHREVAENLRQHVTLHAEQIEEESVFFKAMRTDLHALAKHRSDATEIETKLLQQLSETVQTTRLIEEEVTKVQTSIQASVEHLSTGFAQHQNVQRSILAQHDKMQEQYNLNTKQLGEAAEAFRRNTDKLRTELHEGVAATFTTFDGESAKVANHLAGSVTLLGTTTKSLDKSLADISRGITQLHALVEQLPQAISAGLPQTGNGSPPIASTRSPIPPRSDRGTP